jgi:hypothetical protein
MNSNKTSSDCPNPNGYLFSPYPVATPKNPGFSARQYAENQQNSAQTTVPNHTDSFAVPKPPSTCHPVKLLVKKAALSITKLKYAKENIKSKQKELDIFYETGTLPESIPKPILDLLISCEDLPTKQIFIKQVLKTRNDQLVTKHAELTVKNQEINDTLMAAISFIDPEHNFDEIHSLFYEETNTCEQNFRAKQFNDNQIKIAKATKFAALKKMETEPKILTQQQVNSIIKKAISKQAVSKKSGLQKLPKNEKMDQNGKLDLKTQNNQKNHPHTNQNVSRYKSNVSKNEQGPSNPTKKKAPVKRQSNRS